MPKPQLTLSALSQSQQQQQQYQMQQQEQYNTTPVSNAAGEVQSIVQVPSLVNRALNYNKFIDPAGNLIFNGKTLINSQGVEFQSNGSMASKYKINLRELVVQQEIGKGQYGVVSKVLHVPSNVTMAMKQIRLEISDVGFRQIQMELDVLHRARSEYIVDFYGAFFAEGSVFLCIEYMDVGSLDRLYGQGMEEPVLSLITQRIIKGLQFLKNELNVIHRDVKPTNVLMNSRGQVKLCDFGVSGQLIQSMAKTHIGSQSYMAPERIAGIDPQAPYSVASDVWSLGMTVWECANGYYPFSPKLYDSVFAQLSAIVNERPPPLDSSKFSPQCQDFLDRCLDRNPQKRPSYMELLQHPFITQQAQCSDQDGNAEILKWLQSVTPIQRL
ncbi:hypothetical protein MP228_008536 [Amoeboaphelidium protococcarum]|nr:hypothetical protein MP228_008536 [Amoeboaphelidium protococcarum]